MGGHIVQGHIDGVAKYLGDITMTQKENGRWEWLFPTSVGNDSAPLWVLEREAGRNSATSGGIGVAV